MVPYHPYSTDPATIIDRIPSTAETSGSFEPVDHDSTFGGNGSNMHFGYNTTVHPDASTSASSYYVENYVGDSPQYPMTHPQSHQRSYAGSNEANIDPNLLNEQCSPTNASLHPAQVSSNDGHRWGSPNTYSSDSLIADESQYAAYNFPGSSHISSSYDEHDQANSSWDTCVAVSSQNSSLVPASNSHYFTDSRSEAGGTFRGAQQHRALGVADHSRTLSTYSVIALPLSTAFYPLVESDQPWSPLQISCREEPDPDGRTNRLAGMISGLETNVGAGNSTGIATPQPTDAIVRFNPTRSDDVEIHDSHPGLNWGLQPSIYSYLNDNNHLDVPQTDQPAATASSPTPSVTSVTPMILCCDVVNCNASFKGHYRKGNLARHKKYQHGGEEGSAIEFPCEESDCDHTFKRKDARLKHYRTHHPGLTSGPAQPRKH